MKIAVEGAARRDGLIAQATGWWSERFAREKALQGLGHYLADEEAPAQDVAERLRSWAQGVDARFKRQ